MPVEVDVGTGDLPTRFILLQLRELQPRCNCNRMHLHRTVSYKRQAQNVSHIQIRTKKEHAEGGTQCTHHHSTTWQVSKQLRNTSRVLKLRNNLIVLNFDLFVQKAYFAIKRNNQGGSS
uniref:Uncharacterized protein n=1 Tax=Photinus pyralis TaxID=7054 RepID=A0A1Y1K7W6_PHOPY